MNLLKGGRNGSAPVDFGKNKPTFETQSGVAHSDAVKESEKLIGQAGIIKRIQTHLDIGRDAADKGALVAKRVNGHKGEVAIAASALARDQLLAMLVSQNQKQIAILHGEISDTASAAAQRNLGSTAAALTTSAVNEKSTFSELEAMVRSSTLDKDDAQAIVDSMYALRKHADQGTLTRHMLVDAAINKIAELGIKSTTGYEGD